VVLLSVHHLRKFDNVYTFFNDDNSHGVDNCLRLPSGLFFVPFAPGKKAHELEVCAAPPATAHAQLVNKSKSNTPPATHPRDALTIPASLCHAGYTRLYLSRITVGGLRPTLARDKPHLCRGCLAGARKPAQAGGSRPRGQPTNEHTPPTFYGQLVHSDMCTAFPTSWPHHFKSMVCFCDDYTAEKEFYFTRTSSSDEVTSALRAYVRCNETRLKDGRIHTWKTDNGRAFTGDRIDGEYGAARELAREGTFFIPYVSNTNAVAERSFRVVQHGNRCCLAYAEAPDCLWPWAAAQC
jgi:hypothetical protein